MKKPTTLAMLMVLALGLIFLAIGIGMGIVYIRDAETMVPVNGTIVEVRFDRPTVAYTWEGVAYEYRPLAESASYRVGRSLPLLVDPLDPTRVKKHEPNAGAWIFGVMGALIMGVGIAIGCSGAVTRRRRQALLERGVRAMGKVMAVEPVGRVRENGRHPVRLKVKCEHPVTRRKVIVRSHELGQTSFSEGDTIDVAFHPRRENRFAVDAREAEGLA